MRPNLGVLQIGIKSLDFVMSDSEDSTVTYTEVSSPFEDLPPPSPNYVPGLKEPEQAPPLPNFVPEPIYLEFMPLEDDVLPAEEQPLPAAVSPTADSLSYIIESDPEEDPKEDNEDPDEDPTDYPTDRDDDDDEAEEDDDEVKEVEEHLAPADSVLPPACRTTTRMSIQDQTPIPFPSAAEVDKFLAISTLPPSPLTSYLSPLPHIPSPPLPVSSPLPMSPPPLPDSPTQPLGYRASMIRLRAESPSTSHPLLLPSPIVLPYTSASMAMMTAATPSTYIFASRTETPPSGTPQLLPIPLPTSSPPLLLPSTDCRAGVSEVTLPPQKRLCITLGLRFMVGETQRDVGYGITDTWDEMVKDMQGTPSATDVAGLGQRMTDLVTTVRQDTDEIYGRLDDAQDDRSLMSSQLNLLCRDRCAHARIARLMEGEARASREAWVQSMDANDTTRSETQMAVLQSQQIPARDLVHPDVPEETGMGGRRQAPLSHECTYPDFMNCKPLYFKGTKGVVELTQWFERMETVFRISNCTVENQIKFATCTLLRSALTWWNSHVKIVGHDIAYAMTWTNLKKKMTDKYCPRGEESDKIEKYVNGLPDMIHGSIMASKPKTMQDAIEFATELIDKKIRTFAERQSKNKRKVGHLARDCRSTANANTTNNQKGTKASQKPSCFECGAQGNFKRECPKLKNNNRGNQG
ncbi:putative reverse transcriptase domain-containing protein [Tanacetum coccineum]